MECAGQVSQVAYRVLLEFITQVNDAYNDGGITYNKFIIAEYGSGHPSGLISHEIVGSNPTSATKCASGGMVYTMVLEAIAFGIESSSLALRTRLGDVAQR